METKMSKDYLKIRPYFPTPRHLHGMFINGNKLPEYMTMLGKNEIYLTDSCGKTLETHQLQRDKEPHQQSLEIISSRLQIR